MAQLNKTPIVLRISTGTEANLLAATAYPWQGELALSTDSGIVFVSKTTEGTFEPVAETWRADQTTDTAPTDDTSAKKITLQKLAAPPTNAAYVAFSNNPGTDTFYLVLEDA